MLSFQNVINIIFTNEMCYILFFVFKIYLCFTLIACLNLDAKFLSEIFDLYLEFIKFTVENVDSHP